MRWHRTTASTGVLVLLLAAASLVAAAPAATPKPVTLLFPVVGPATYEDDFGQPRAGGPHQGIDILAPRKAIAVAVEAGKVKFWTTSASAGCMLYLYGQSGTTYLYIHLNNDRGNGNDNKGRCVPGTAYAPGLKDGAHVQAGQQIGFVGDSGDADGIHPHLHFEVHPTDGKAVDPFSYLQGATPLLFSSKPGAPFSLVMTGTVTAVDSDRLVLQVNELQSLPSGAKQTNLTRALTVVVSPTAIVLDRGESSTTQLLSASAGQAVVVWTQPALATLKAERGDDGALTAAIVELGP